MIQPWSSSTSFSYRYRPFEKFQKDNPTHISGHIQEWCRRKRLIKANIQPNFLLEWFLNSLLLYNVQDVSTSGVTTQEHAIFIDQQLYLIYAQFGILYEIIHDAPLSNTDPKFKPMPHVNGIVGSVSTKSFNHVTNKMKNLSINQSIATQYTSSSTTTQSIDVLSMQSSNQKGNQRHRRNRKKGRNNKRGGNRKENQNHEKNDDNGGGEET